MQHLVCMHIPQNLPARLAFYRCATENKEGRLGAGGEKKIYKMNKWTEACGRRRAKGHNRSEQKERALLRLEKLASSSPGIPEEPWRHLCREGNGRESSPMTKTKKSSPPASTADDRNWSEPKLAAKHHRLWTDWKDWWHWPHPPPPPTPPPLLHLAWVQKRTNTLLERVRWSSSLPLAKAHLPPR